MICYNMPRAWGAYTVYLICGLIVVQVILKEKSLTFSPYFDSQAKYIIQNYKIYK